MKFVVTGATGFIGRNFVREVVSAGHNVIAVCHKGSVNRGSLSGVKNLECIDADMTEYGTLDKLINSADVFVHFAWDGIKNTADRDSNTRVQQQNVENSLAALKTSKRMGCKLFVFAGSQAEYGPTKEIESETLPCNPVTEYGIAKLQFKEKAFGVATRLQLKYAHLRIFSIYGEEDHERTLVKTCLRNMLAGEAISLSACTQNWNFLYIQDAVKQIRLLSERAVENDDFGQQIFNVASEENRPLKDFVNIMKEETESQSPLHFGEVAPTNVVNLNPDVSKMRKWTDFIANNTFRGGFRRMVTLAREK
jgi:nucleoside-diphosphate-sugar epimerase